MQLMPVVVYIRGAPGTGKRTVADLLERDLKWPVLWVHHFDAVYNAIGEYKAPSLTNKLMLATAQFMFERGKNFLVVRPSRDALSVRIMAVDSTRYRHQYKFIPVRLTASYRNLCTRVTRRWHESPFRLTTKEALDEYLDARPEQPFDGEHVIDTDNLTPEQVAGKIKELL